MACKKYLRELLLVGIYMLGILGIMASGSSGDDDDDDEIIIQSIYNFTIGGPLPDDPGNNSIIGIERQGDFTVSTEPNLVGTVICDQASEVCELQTIDPPSSVIMTGDYDIQITVVNTWNYNPLPSDRPRFGRLLIERGVQDITAEVMDCGVGSPGVEVQGTIDGSDACYQWDNFEDLADNPGDSDAALASLAWEAVSFTVDQGSNALEVFPLIVDDVFATLGNPITESCDTWLGGWPVNPPALNPGFLTFGWLDDSGNGRVGPGDSFSQTFNECWFGDPNDDGTLLDGSIDYVGYTQVIDQNGLLTRI
ncbi:MAG: hypothetical protein KJN90_12490, partial [Gammaproteobacteria bacterium]|nr:hypothetical protein [Gammaproteobacteria bacterium]